MANKICPICKSEYNFCRTCEETYSPVMFVWRAVTCSPKCFRVYMQNIEDFENENRVVQQPLNIENTKGDTYMQAVLKDGKSYDIEKIDVKNCILKVKDVEKNIKIDEIVEILYVRKEDVVDLAKLIESAKTEK